jgi:hypothetical protein
MPGTGNGPATPANLSAFDPKRTSKRFHHVRQFVPLNVLAVNIVFKFIDKVLLFRNYSLEQIADRDNADHFFAFEHR